ncbi:unnamed protein product [Ophioblennius macclurei]
MSRRSLRLQAGAGLHGNDSLSDLSRNHSSYASTSKETRVLRNRKPQASSSSRTLSFSQIATPRKALSFLAASTPINSGAGGGGGSDSNLQDGVAESDAAQLTSALDQSHQRQRTATTRTTRTTTTTTSVNERWVQGSGQGTSGVNGEASTSKSHAALANGYICRDCSFHSQKNADSLKARSPPSSSLSLFPSSPSSPQAAGTRTDALSSPSSPFTSIYTRDRTRKSKSGVLASMSHKCMHYSKRAFAPMVSVFTTLLSSVVWLGSKVKSSSERGVLAFSDSLRRAASSSLSQLWLLKENTLHRMMGYNANGYEGQARSSYKSSLNAQDTANKDVSTHLTVNGTLCDDCKATHHSETHTVLTTQSSRPRRLAGALWSVLAFAGQPGHGLVRAGAAVGSGAGTVAQSFLATIWTLFAAPAKAGRGLLWLLATGWYQLVSLMSVLNVFFLTRCLPKLWKLLWLLLPLLLLLALWLWGPSTSALLAYLPAINLTEWRRASPVAFLYNMLPASGSVPAPTLEAPLKPTPASPVSQATTLPPPIALSDNLNRLELLERQLALLWQQVQQGDQKHDERHRDVLGLYDSLREQLRTQTDRESLALWVSSLLTPKLSALREELERENTVVAQKAEQQKHQHESQASRLAELELTLTALSARTEDLQKKQQLFEHETEKKVKEAISSAADSTLLGAGMKQEAHDALLAEVRRLEAELGQVRADLQGVAGCKGKCEQLGTLQETITAQVTAQMRKELHDLFYGAGGSGGDQKEVPESMIVWLSQRYATTQDLQASLASLELSILRNISLQLEQDRAQTRGGVESQAKTLVHTVTGSVRHASAGEGLSEEQVKLIVQNALKLYSQDQTGMVDYALESGGGAVLSTRCTETYETKTALLSLFGVPFWYFTQSPRVVIQPDVYPGNCWAFKGSQGYLVIRLSLRVLPTSFCMEHIPKALSPAGNITSAPRNFTVYGLDDEDQEEGKLLGQYTYQEEGESLQLFPVMEENNKAFQIIEVRVLSNWGHPDYTCLYRFRVHGEPRPQ